MADTFDYGRAMEEIDQRVAVLRRYRSMLDLQKEKLSSYLHVVDSREAALAQGTFDDFETYTVLEQEAVKGIQTVQRCLAPLKLLYLELHPEGSPDIASMEDRLERLRQEVLRRNEESRMALKTYAASLKLEISKLRSTTVPQSLFASTRSGSLIDVAT